MTDPTTSPRPTPPASDAAARAVAVPDVSVVIVTYNVREFLEQAIESVLQASQDLAVEVFVVDNDSADGSAEMVRERFPEVRLIANAENTGFATANNQALRLARGRYALVLNPDTLVQEDTLRAFVDFMDAHPDVGAAGCRILNPDGTFAPESRRAFPTPAVAFYRISGLGKLFPKSPRFGRYNLTFLPRDEVCEVDALSGSCMVVRREAMWGAEPELSRGALPARETLPTGEPLGAAPGDSERRAAGVFDESFFMYGEDLDWCYRIQRAGWKICYTPSTQIVHYKGESTKKGDLRYVMLFYGAMLRFVEKHMAAGRAEARPGERLSAGALALGLRTGIVARGAVAALGRLARELAAPATDLALAWVVLTVVALARTAGRTFTFDPVYYAAVLPGYAAALVIGVALAGGYRGRHPRRSVAIGGTLAFLTLSTAALFVPSLAFSRATLLAGSAAAVLALLARRALRRAEAGPRRVLVVGSAPEAERLRRLVGTPDALAGRRLRPALAVVGRVSDEAGRRGGDAPLGPRRQLRDLARLHAADEVVFASESLTNTAILEGMRALRDLPVSLKILASGHDRIIGKASIEDFSGPLLDAERTVAPLRPRRRFDVTVALVILALRPLLRLGARLRPKGRLAHAAALAGRMAHVVAGRRALVGYAAEGTQPPPAWGLQPALVSVLDSLPARPATITETHRAYWYYARHQSAALDLEILVRAAFRAPGGVAA